MGNLASVVTAVGIIVVAVMQMRTKQAVDTASADRKAESVAAISATEEVKNTLQESTKAADKKLGEIHTLVNSNMERQLRLTSVALRRIAQLTKKPEDKKAAELAEELLRDHVAKQAIVDAGNGK